MIKPVMTTFRVSGYAVNKRGLTKGFSYPVEAEDAPTARSAAFDLALKKGMTFPHVLNVIPVPVADHQQEIAE